MFVEMKGLSFRYKSGSKPILENFNLELEKGHVLSILGESGSGKSTVLRLLSGLEKPQKGYIMIDNKVMINENVFVPPEKRNIGMVFQDYALFPHMTVGQNIQFGLKKLSKVEKESRVNEILKLVNLEEFKSRYPYELSGGQQQRVALGRALAPTPSLLLLDEPFSSLDTNLKRRIRDDLKEIISEVGITTIIVTHDQDDA
ncbi:ABC transporter ATP-binding protein, partial [Anaerosolibacter sp.]|uniref:ABC transporter ATP-binding protein n=1 Tax=Anaerosolibacter sp. TaxID=1872527 RepID=UPI0039F0C517